jgi:hypothetical protein
MSVHRVTLSCLVSLQVCQNVVHVWNPDGTLTDSAIATEFSGNWLTNIKQFQHDGARWFDIESKRVDSGPSVAFHLTISQVGTGAAQTAQDNPVACRVLKFATATPGRHGHGRIYIPGTAQGAWDNGVVKASSLTAGASLITSLQGRYTGASPGSGLSLVIVPRSDPSSTHFVTSIQQRTVLGYQRRRSIGVGF